MQWPKICVRDKCVQAGIDDLCMHVGIKDVCMCLRMSKMCVMILMTCVYAPSGVRDKCMPVSVKGVCMCLWMSKNSWRVKLLLCALQMSWHVCDKKYLICWPWTSIWASYGNSIVETSCEGRHKRQATSLLYERLASVELKGWKACSKESSLQPACAAMLHTTAILQYHQTATTLVYLCCS